MMDHFSTEVCQRVQPLGILCCHVSSSFIIFKKWQKACSLQVKTKKKVEEQIVCGSFQASFCLSTPAFDMKTQISYSRHPQNPIQGHGHWDQPVAIAED